MMCKAIWRSINTAIDDYVHRVFERTFGRAYPIISPEDAARYAAAAKRRTARMEQRRLEWEQRRHRRHMPQHELRVTIPIDPNHNIYHQVRQWHIHRNGGSFTAKDWQRLLARDKCCLCCGTTKELSRDHIIPVTKGGSHSFSNAQVLCRSCNSRKGVQIIDYRTKD